MSNKPHVHAELIKAWADGAIIEFQGDNGTWIDIDNNTPRWLPELKYRVKPQKRKCWVVLRQNFLGEYFTSTADSENQLSAQTSDKSFVRVLQKIEYNP